MSGIEIAGIVLAALSAAAGVVKNYDAIAIAAHNTLRPRRRLRRLQSLLLVEREMFRNTCEILLAGIAGEAETFLLLSRPGGPDWKKPKLEVMLQQKCHTSYSAVCTVLEKMQKAISDLQGYIDASPTRAFESALFRIQSSRLGLGGETQKTLLEEIREGNKSFERIVKQSLWLEPIRARRRRQARDFASARREASETFAVLEQALQCGCGTRHALYLCLQTWSLRTENERSQFVLAVDQGRLATFDTSEDASTCARQTVVQQLCQALNNNSTADLPKAVGLLQDNGSTKRSIVLSAYFSGNVDRAKGGQLTFRGRDRRRLALVVAASLLRLYSTPWVDDRWVRDRIGFARKHGGLRSASPLLEKSWSNAISIATVAPSPLRLMSIRSESLFALGIFLIELCFQKDFSSLQEPGDKIEGGLLDRLTEFRTAIRLIPEVYREAGERYGDVVRRCIRCDFDHKSYDLDNEDFCQAVYEGVVSPLEDDVKLIDGAEALAECASGFQLK